MARKVYVNVTTRIIIDMDDDMEVSEVIENMDYHFQYYTLSAEIVSTEIIDHEVVDVK